MLFAVLDEPIFKHTHPEMAFLSFRSPVNKKKKKLKFIPSE